ncbi:glycosyltransferase family 4 protein, partial [Escherichia coli]|uniref:glycosyltransferase family 4 protein n=1 Tax=Escherichia coli TaxID=562 RepID=UPI0010CBE2AB
MKVLFLITRGDELGGAQTHVKDVILGLINKYNIECYLACGTKGIFTDIMEENNINVIHIDSMKREICFGDIIALKKLNDIIKDINPDIISCHSSKAGVLGRLASLGTRTKKVFTAHGWAFTEGISPKKAAIYKKIELLLSYITDATINVSYYDKKLALKAGLKSQHYVIHNCIPDVHYKKNNGIANKTVLEFIMVARFCAQKDHETLLKACSNIDKEKWRLTLIGGGDSKSIKELAKKLNIDKNINFVGQTKNVVDFLNHSDVFLLISNWEGFPISILEAMRSSLPIIATDVGGVSEAVKHGYNGFLINKGNVAELEETILKIIESYSSLKILSQNSRKTYCERFKVDKMIDLYASIFYEVLK